MRLKDGRDGRIRTCDILIPNQALYQAELHPELRLARPRGLEPLTFWFVAKHSIQLSYGRMILPIFPDGGDGGS